MNFIHLLVGAVVLIGLTDLGLAASVVNIGPINGARIEGSVGRGAREVSKYAEHVKKGVKDGEISVFVHDAPIAGSSGLTKCPDNGAAIAGAVIEDCGGLIFNSGPIAGAIIHGNGKEGEERDKARGVYNSGAISGGEIFGNVGRVARDVGAFNDKPINGGVIKGDVGRVARDIW